MTCPVFLFLEVITIHCNVTALRYYVKVGRPREHNEATAVALLEAAERTVQAAGLEGLSVRRLADDVGTTTRAVYTLFGSKDGLLVALGTRAFAMLGASIAELPETEDPAADLVEAGVAVFRRFAIGHPSLFGIGVQQTVGPTLAGDFAKLCRASRVAAEIEVARVPLSDAAKAVLAAEPAMLETALTGGDDFEIVCTVPAGKADSFRAAAKAADVAVSEIGEIKAGEGVRFVDSGGRTLAFKRASFSHF